MFLRKVVCYLRLQSPTRWGPSAAETGHGVIWFCGPNTNETSWQLIPRRIRGPTLAPTVTDTENRNNSCRPPGIDDIIVPICSLATAPTITHDVWFLLEHPLPAGLEPRLTSTPIVVQTPAGDPFSIRGNTDAVRPPNNGPCTKMFRLSRCCNYPIKNK